MRKLKRICRFIVQVILSNVDIKNNDLLPSFLLLFHYGHYRGQNAYVAFAGLLHVNSFDFDPLFFCA